jgi:alpha-tubulin suppressor-like RCC1 family protein
VPAAEELSLVLVVMLLGAVGCATSEPGPRVELRFKGGTLRWPLAEMSKDRLWLGWAGMGCRISRDGRFGCWGGGDPADVVTEELEGVPMPAWIGCLEAIPIRYPGDPKCTLVQARAERASEIRWLFAYPTLRYAVMANGQVQRWEDGSLTRKVRGLRGAVQAVTGSDCARLGDGSVRCWVDERGERWRTWRPDVRGVVELAGYPFNNEVCAVLGTGSVVCWQNDPDKWRMWPVEGLQGAVDIEVNFGTGCARLVDGGVACWEVDERTPARRVAGAEKIVELAVGYKYACGLDEHDDVFCWGDNREFALGDAESEPFLRRPVRVPGVPVAAEVLIGREETCARTSSGELWCWGGKFMDEAQLRTEPTRIAEGVRLVSLTGGVHAELRPGVVSRWDRDWSRRWGIPVDAEALGVGDYWGCALRSGGVTCDSMRRYPWFRWGWTRWPDAAMVTLSVAFKHGCAAVADGRARCWGETYGHGELGPQALVEADVSMRDPVEVTGLPPVDDVAIHWSHACARTRTKELWCWGVGSEGQLGARTGPRGQPRQVPGLPPVAQIALGRAHTCIRSEAGEVWCWGRNTRGQLGRGDTSKFSDSPARVPGLAGVVSLAAYGDTSCAVVADGGVLCWGDNLARKANLGGPLRSDAAVRVDEAKMRWFTPP